MFRKLYFNFDDVYNNQFISGGKDIVHSFSSIYDVTIPASASHDLTTISSDFNLSRLNLCSIILKVTAVINEFDMITLLPIN